MSIRRAPLPTLWRVPAALTVQWLTLPLLLLLGYGFGVAVAATFALWIAHEVHTRRPGRWLGVAGGAGVLIALDVVEQTLSVADSMPTHTRWVRAVFLVALLVAGRRGVARLRRLAPRDDDAAAAGDPRVQAVRRADFFGASLVLGAWGCAFMDEPLLGVGVAFVAASVLCAVRAERLASALQTRVDALLAGRDPEFVVEGDGETGARVFALVDGSPFRARDAVGVRAVLVAGTPSVGLSARQARRVILAVAGLCLALWSHATTSHNGSLALARYRHLIVQRPVPAAVRALYPRKSSFQRLQDVVIPGASVWQNCAFPTCSGAVVVVDDARGEVISSTEAMRRVPDRSPLHLARTRLALTALHAEAAVRSARSCGDVILVTSSPGYVLDLANGAILELSSSTPDCRRAARMLELQRARSLSGDAH